MHPFDQDISLKNQEPFRFDGRISDNWSINGTPNGGYLMAILAHAMWRNSEKKDTPILTTGFFSRCSPGRVRVAVEKITESTQFCRLQASLFQAGKEKIRAMGTFASKKEECLIERFETKPPAVSALDACVAIPELPGYTLFRNLDIRLDPGSAGWMEGRLTDRSKIKGWVKFQDDRSFDVFSIALIADAFPPPIFSSQGAVAWVPTLEFSVNVRHIPKGTWLKCVFSTRFINCGLLEEDGEIWDESGTLVAISRQIAQFRPSAPPAEN